MGSTAQRFYGTAGHKTRGRRSGDADVTCLNATLEVAKGLVCVYHRFAASASSGK
jgi:hypothetical protein